MFKTLFDLITEVDCSIVYFRTHVLILCAVWYNIHYTEFNHNYNISNCKSISNFVFVVSEIQNFLPIFLSTFLGNFYTINENLLFSERYWFFNIFYSFGLLDSI